MHLLASTSVSYCFVVCSTHSCKSDFCCYCCHSTDVQLWDVTTSEFKNVDAGIEKSDATSNTIQCAKKIN